MVSFSSDRFDFYRLTFFCFLWLSYLLLYFFLDFHSKNPELQYELTFHLLLSFDFNLFVAELEEKIYYVNKEDGLQINQYQNAV